MSRFFDSFNARARLSQAEPYLRLIEALAVVLAVLAFGLEFADRQQARTATMWQLAGTDSPGRKAALEYLNDRGERLARVRADGAYLGGVKLANAVLTNASLGHANLAESDLRNANLVNADLRHAVLFDADLGGADFLHARLADAILEGAVLAGAKNLSQEQLDLVKCTKPPESLPVGLAWPARCRQESPQEP